MPRGRITIQIRRRIITTSTKYKNMWDQLDKIRMETIPDQRFLTLSAKTGKKFHISKTELAFVKFVAISFGPGDYSIILFGKGKNRGYRRFWDGLITPDRKFLRRKESSSVLRKSSIFERDSNSYDTESFIGRYFRTMRPGIWYNF